MEPLVAEIERSFAHVERELNNPEVFGDPKRAAELGRQHKRLKAANDLAQRWRELQADIAEANEMFEDSEEEIRLMAREQKQAAEADLPEIEESLRLAMVEPDPNDGANVIVEIRPGAGGDEAALWTGDLFDMYLKFCERQPAAKAEIISVTYSDAGGYKEAFISVKGDEAWQLLKWESGVHRVQRVPVTESQGAHSHVDGVGCGAA